MQTVTVYFDYLCPFAWRGLELANVVAPQLGLDLQLRHFSLEQGSHKENLGMPRNAPVWRLVEQPLEGSKALRAFWPLMPQGNRGELLICVLPWSYFACAIRTSGNWVTTRLLWMR